MSSQLIKTSPSGRYRLVKSEIKSEVKSEVKNHVKIWVEVNDQPNLNEESKWILKRPLDHLRANDIKLTGFFSKGGQDWLHTIREFPEDILLINLETGLEITHSSNFCWCDLLLNPDQTILAVCGCVWGGPYEVRFFDITILEQIRAIPSTVDLELQGPTPSWIGDSFQYIMEERFCQSLDKYAKDLTIEDLIQLSLISGPISWIDRLSVEIILKYIDEKMSPVHFWTTPEYLSSDFDQSSVEALRLNPGYHQLKSAFPEGELMLSPLQPDCFGIFTSTHRMINHPIDNLVEISRRDQPYETAERVETDLNDLKLIP